MHTERKVCMARWRPYRNAQIINLLIHTKTRTMIIARDAIFIV